MKYIFLVEDKLHEVIKILVRRVLQEENLENVSTKFYFHRRGDLTNINFLKRRVTHLETKGEIDKVFILYDSECHEYSTSQEYLETCLEQLIEEDPRVIPCVVAHALESWLLYDQDYLGRLLRVRNYHLPGDIEISTQYCSPKPFIQDEFRQKSGKKFIMRTHGKQIAREMNLTTLDRSKSFTFLKEKLLQGH
ncbi:MAG: DUF4276 family protein [Candidatus Helarchaeota archaeon]